MSAYSLVYDHGCVWSSMLREREMRNEEYGTFFLFASLYYDLGNTYIFQSAVFTSDLIKY